MAQQKLYLRAILPECFHKQLDLRKALTISGTQSLVVWDKVMNRPSWDLLELRRLIDVYHRLCFPSAFLNTTMYNSTKRSVTISRSKFDDLGLAHARLRLYQLTGIMTYLHFDDDYISVWLVSPWVVAWTTNGVHLYHRWEVTEDHLRLTQGRFWKYEEKFQQYFAYTSVVYPRLITDEK